MPQPPAQKTGKRVAVVGSGPAGMACAQQLARAGHDVVLFEKADRIGGLLRYGIPDFKMEKHLIDRRMAQMADRGRRVPARRARRRGRRGRRRCSPSSTRSCSPAAPKQPRDLPVPGRDLAGIHFAMEFLPQQNKRRRRRHGAGDRSSRPASTWSSSAAATPAPTASARRTARARSRSRSSSCCRSRRSRRTSRSSWPYWPIKLRTSSSHEEGCKRDWAVATKRFEGTRRQGREARRVRASNGSKDADGRDEDGRGARHRVRDEGRPRAARDGLRRPGARRACSSSSASRSDPRSNVQGGHRRLSHVGADKVFAAGDMRRGQSLVVWAIREGRQCARAVDVFLMGSVELPR